MPTMIDGNMSSRRYTSIGFSGSYARNFKRFKAGCRLGIVTRKLQETQDYSFTDNNSSYSSTAYFNYEQKHVMGSLFIAREERIKFISVQLGLEVPFIHYGKGRSELVSNYRDFESGKLYSEIPGSTTTTVGSGYATGLGSNLGLGCQLSKGMSIGLEICEYLLQTKFSKPTVSELYYDEHFTTPEQTRHHELKWSQNLGYSQLGFSRVSFRMFYAVKF